MKVEIIRIMIEDKILIILEIEATEMIVKNSTEEEIIIIITTTTATATEEIITRQAVVPEEGDREDNNSNIDEIEIANKFKNIIKIISL